MRRVELPYGKGTITGWIEEGRICGILSSGLENYKAAYTPEVLVAQALANPIGTEPLHVLSQGKRKITIIASDHTRPVPSKLLLPALLTEIRRGNPSAEITILIATGCHRGTTEQELLDKFGEKIVREERIVIHDCDDDAHMCHLGTLPSGGACFINDLACDADLLVSEGFIEPHFFAGYSGGRKSVLPGVAGRATVLANHCAEFIANEKARAGSLSGNPIHTDMLWAAEKAGLAFILNVVLDGERNVIHAVAGAAAEAHAAGCRFLDGLCRVAPAPADIVISTNGGYPLDQNIYQAVKGMTAAEATVNPGGVIIMVAQSGDGHGGDAFCREMEASASLDQLRDGILLRKRQETKPDQWQAQVMIRVLQKAQVVFVSDAEDSLVKRLHMIPAHSLAEGLQLAEELLQNHNAGITVIPDGVSVIVTK